MLFLSQKPRSIKLQLRLLTGVLLTLTAVLALNIQPAQAQGNTPTTDNATYLIQFQPGAGEAERNAWLASQGAELVSWLPQIGVAEVRLNGAQAAGLASSAADMAPVLHIEADAPVSGDVLVTEPAYNNPDQGYAQQMLQLARAWDVTEGDENIVIAIVDTGITLNHPEFQGRLTAGYDFVNNDDDPSDDHGHGTHIAGIAAAGLNGLGTVGVCPECKLMPVKVLNARNGGTGSLVTKGILYAVDHGARVINLSLGAQVSSATMESAIRYAAEKNVVVVAASGNNGSEMVFYPAAVPSVIAVSGTDRNDKRWAQSNYGSYVDVAAPAVSIYSAYFDLVNTSGYAYMSGTSMATPFVTGLVGLTISRQPELTVAEVTALITDHAVDLGASGKDKEFGYGRIDVYATLLAANGDVVPTPQAPPVDGNAVALYLPSIQVAK